MSVYLFPLIWTTYFQNSYAKWFYIWDICIYGYLLFFLPWFLVHEHSDRIQVLNSLLRAKGGALRLAKGAHLFLVSRIKSNFLVELVRYLEPKKAASDLVSTLRRARPRHIGLGKNERRQRQPSLVAPSASRVITAAANLLPPAYRVRYTEEYRAELLDLAKAGAGYRQQFQYAILLVICAPSLRRSLLVPHRERSLP
jgi:hypothetical protein